jgi:hypothetical protein
MTVSPFQHGDWTVIKLRDTITIQTTPERIFKWLESLPQEYCAWHPDHVACRVVRGSLLQPGCEIECQEYLHGQLHILRLCLTRVDPGKRMEYEIPGLGKGAFEVIPEDSEVEFVAELGVGSDFPIVGSLVDVVLRALLSRRLEAMKRHMREEGQNLKKILESSWRAGSTGNVFSGST